MRIVSRKMLVVKRWVNDTLLVDTFWLIAIGASFVYSGPLLL
jgi:hypothetical protein